MEPGILAYSGSSFSAGDVKWEIVID